MNDPQTVADEVTSKPAAPLLDAIFATRESVGEGLSDEELTRLLQQ
jgi:hypothetical protein